MFEKSFYEDKVLDYTWMIAWIIFIPYKTEHFLPHKLITCQMDSSNTNSGKLQKLGVDMLFVAHHSIFISTIYSKQEIPAPSR